MDRLRSIDMFVRAVETGNLSRAAEALQLSPAAVSRGVAELEAHLGIRLLQRSSRRLALTEGGQAFYERAKQILQDLEEAEAVAAATTTQPTGTLKVNAPLTFGIRHLAPLWPRFVASYPAIRLDLSLSDQVVDVLEGGYDLVVRIARLQSTSLVARKLAATRMILCAAPAYLAEHGEPQSPAQLSRHRCLGYSYWTSHDEWEFTAPDGAERIRVRVDSPFRANNGDSLREAALAGVGIALQPSFLVGADVARGELVELLPGYRSLELGIYALMPTRKHLPTKVRVLVDFLIDAFGGAPERDPWAPG